MTASCAAAGEPCASGRECLCRPCAPVPSPAATVAAAPLALNAAGPDALSPAEALRSAQLSCGAFQVCLTVEAGDAVLVAVRDNLAAARPGACPLSVVRPSRRSFCLPSPLFFAPALIPADGPLPQHPVSRLCRPAALGLPAATVLVRAGPVGGDAAAALPAAPDASAGGYPAVYSATFPAPLAPGLLLLEARASGLVLSLSPLVASDQFPRLTSEWCALETLVCFASDTE